MPLIQDPTDPKFLSQYAGGDPAGASLQGTMVQPPAAPAQPAGPPAPPAGLFGTTPPVGAQFSFQSYLQTAVDRLNANNDLVKQKNLLIKQLYDTGGLKPDELSSLPQPLQQAISSGNRPDMEMQLRLLNDQIAGRTNTMNQSIDFLTKGYQQSVADAQQRQQQAISNVLSFASTYGSNAKSALTSLYGPQYVSQLKDMGIDLDKFAAVPTVAQQWHLGGGTGGSGGGVGGEYTPIDVSNIKDKNVGLAEFGGLSYNGLYNAAKVYLTQNKMPALGLGQAADVKKARQSIVNFAGQLADAIGMDSSQIQALYKANSKAASNVIDRVAKIETTAQSLAAQFPRLATLAESLKMEGVKITESDIQAGAAAALRKFGSTTAASYIELVQTVRGDYAAMQAAVGGSRGGEFFARNAQDAIPIGLTSDQYLSIQQTIITSAQNSLTATQDEANRLLGVGASMSPDSGGNSYDAYKKALGL